MIYTKWSKEETFILETNMEKDLDELEKLLPARSRGSISSKIRKLDGCIAPSSGNKWTEEEIEEFPEDKNVDSKILSEIAQRLPLRNKNSIWKKLKSLGYIWIKSDADLTPTEDNPYPMHGKPWTQEEIDQFPVTKIVNVDILKETQDKIPLRKPTAIWPKMRTLGYIWEEKESVEAAPVDVVKELSPDAQYLVSFLHELGFRNPSFQKRGVTTLGMDAFKAFDIETNHHDEIAEKYDLPKDFNSRQLHYALGSVSTAFPWEMSLLPEMLAAQKDPTILNVKAAAQALKARLEDYLNG